MEKFQQALHDRSLSALDRLKVACYLWKNSHNPKNIVKWICDQICFVDKKKSPDLYEELVTHLFKFLFVILRTPNDGEWCPIDSLFTAHFFTSVSEAFLQITSEECLVSVIECLQWIVTASPLPSVLFKFELMVSLFRSILFAMATNSGAHILIFLSSLLPFLQLFEYVQSRHGNQKKMFTTVCDELLDPMLLVRSLLTSEEHKHSSEEFVTQLENILQQMFNRETLAECPSAVSSSDWLGDSDKQTATSYVRVLFTSLHSVTCSDPSCPHRSYRIKSTKSSELCQTERTSLAACEGLPTILETFLLQNSSHHVLPKPVEFKFFQRLFEILTHSHTFLPELADTEVESSSSELVQTLGESYLRETSGASSASEPPSSTLQSLAKCLNVVFKYEVYNAGEDRSSGGEQTLFLKKLVQNLLQSATQQNLADILPCLTTLLHLNHKLVEPWLPLVWMCLSTDSLKGDQFTQACVDTYWKLRQLPLLVSTYLESMDLLSSALSHHALSLSPSPSLSKSSESLLANRISSLPPGQCVEMIEHFHGYFTQRVNTDGGGSAMGDPLVINLVPSLEKVADLLSVVLGNVPLSVWTSHLKDKALTALLKLHEEVSLPFLQASYTKKCRKRLSAVALIVTCATSQLLALVKSLNPDLLQIVWLPELVWHDRLSLMVPEAWSSWLPSTVERLGPMRLYLLKRLAVVWVKATLTVSSEGDDQVKQAVLGVCQHQSEEMESGAPWSGQTFDLRTENSEEAHWSLLLSHLPLLYPHTSQDHLTAMAADITTALHSTEGTLSSLDGLSVGRVVREFLNSDAFLEMATLQELLLTSALSQVQVAATATFPKSLRKRNSESAKFSSDAVFLDESFVKSLSDCLRYSVDAFQTFPDQPPPKKLTKWLSGIRATLELLEKLPFRCLTPVSLQRALLMLCAWHSSLSLTVLHSPEDIVPLLTRVSYLLGWVLQCLSLSPPLSHTPKSSKSKRESVANLCVKFSDLMDLMCKYLYKGGACFYGYSKLTENAEFLSALWVLLEMGVDVRVKVGGHPSKVVEMVSEVIRNDSECPFAEKWLLCITRHSCKYHRGVDSASKRPRPHLEQLCDVVLSLLERLGTANEVVSEHPQLISSLAAVLKCRPELASPRVMSVVQSLRVPESRDIDLDSTLEERSPLVLQHQLNQLNALIDYVYLSSLSAHLVAADDMCDEADDLTEAHTTVTSTQTAWSRLLSSLTHLFQFALTQLHQLNPLEYLTTVREGDASDSKRELVVKMVYEKITSAMKEVASMADREELSVLIEELSQTDCSDPVSVCVFCVSWKVILDSKLKQPCREGLRRYYSKVVTLCHSSSHALSTNTPLVTGLVQLVTRIVSLPTQAGLDNQSVIVCLQMVSLLKPSSFSMWRVKLLGAVSEMVVSVCRQHSTAISSAPAAVVTAVIRLIHEVVAMGQDVEEQLAGPASKESLSAELRTLVHCASVVSRALEFISHQVVFCKFVTYILHEFIVRAHRRPLHSEVRDSLLPGVFSLVKLTSPGDIAFLKSPMDSVTRENCQTLLDQYKQYYKFGGRV